MVNVTKEKEFDVISVKDNGMGIDTIKQKNIFEKYFQVQDYIKGSGIGLYLVKQIVNQFGGKILLDSHLGEGSEFKLYLKAL